jgi:hypothetical protein
MEPSAVALRAVLKKEGCPDVRFELRRNSAYDYTIVENGKVSALWWTLSRQQALSGGSAGPAGLAETWERCMTKRFPGYAVTELEECPYSADAAGAPVSAGS